MRPSHCPALASSMKASMGAVSPFSRRSMLVANSKRPGTLRKAERSAARRASSVSPRYERPLRKMRSKATRRICTRTSPALSSLRRRVESTWNGRMHCFSRSYATTSPSMMKLCVSAPAASRATGTRSGNLTVLLSMLRLKTRIVPSGRRWTCARSPSYFHSHVMRWPWSLVSTSEMALDGLASMGARGMPGVTLQASWSAYSGVDSSAPTSAA
mmetsp:Transcript_6403/g.21583  ORF Transcript_6403/g.21583 Transcript_6403/m.21583 type:complete len:214 (+) Transcript_6403:590-1231(+)